MRFQQLSDLFKHMLVCRESLASSYHQLGAQASFEKTRLLLHYLEERERKGLSYYHTLLNDSPKDIAQTWVDISSDTDILAQIKDVNLNQYMDADAILTWVMVIEDQLLALLEQAQQSLGLGHAKESLSQVIEHHNNRQHQLVHSVHRLDDM